MINIITTSINSLYNTDNLRKSLEFSENQELKRVLEFKKDNFKVCGYD